MRVRVTRVSIPSMSTIGYGWGTDTTTGKPVKFAGDHRPMRHLGEAIVEARAAHADAPVVELEDWQILGELGAMN